MRRMMVRILTVILVMISVIGCGTADTSNSDDVTDTVESSINGETSATFYGNSEHTETTTTTTEQKTTTQNTIEDMDSSSTVSPSSATTTGNTISPTVTPTPVGDLPAVKFSAKDSNVRFTDMVNLTNGGFAVAGHWYAETAIESIIQIYDKNALLEKEYKFYNGNGCEEIASCSDGGLIAASSFSPHIIKINRNFETEWSVAYEETSKFRHVFDVEEINPNCYAITFVSADDVRKLNVALLDKSGKILETINLIEDDFPVGTDIIPDGNSGFYLLSVCNKSLADKYSLVAKNYDSSKANEAIILRFSAERELIWVKTLGGEGNDWIEEGAIDNNGNLYLAVGTDWYGADSFWEMSVERSLPYRRMLIKLDKNGNIVYRTPLANKGLAVDQVFGIHIKDDNAYVVGMSDYFDGYQVKYPCEQISPSEKGERVFCVYNICIDANGEELDRKILRCDINDMPCDSVMLPNGSLIIAGKVSAVENPFNLEFPLGVDSAAALFIYK